MAGFLVFLDRLLLLIPAAPVGAWRSRLSRTCCRGVRFSFRGHLGTLMGLYFKGSLPMVVTLGLYRPTSPIASYVLMPVLLIPMPTLAALWFKVKGFNSDNDYALGRIVEYLSHSKWWPNMAIFITEDDAQGGVDHIDSHRTIMLVVSPYAKKNYVSHVNTSSPGMLKTVFRLLGLPSPELV